jgi:hypothetical protein
MNQSQKCVLVCRFLLKQYKSFWTQITENTEILCGSHWTHWNLLKKAENVHLRIWIWSHLTIFITSSDWSNCYFSWFRNCCPLLHVMILIKRSNGYFVWSICFQPFLNSNPPQTCNDPPRRTEPPPPPQCFPILLIRTAEINWVVSFTLRPPAATGKGNRYPIWA